MSDNLNLLTWQDIDPYHKRAAVPGGWLVKTYEDVMTPRDTYCGMLWQGT
jgi:hypothetical protein